MGFTHVTLPSTHPDGLRQPRVFQQCQPQPHSHLLRHLLVQLAAHLQAVASTASGSSRQAVVNQAAAIHESCTHLYLPPHTPVGTSAGPHQGTRAPAHTPAPRRSTAPAPPPPTHTHHPPTPPPRTCTSTSCFLYSLSCRSRLKSAICLSMRQKTPCTTPGHDQHTALPCRVSQTAYKTPYTVIHTLHRNSHPTP